MGEKNFTGVLQKLLTTNPAHADLFNKLFDTLLQNDLFLKEIAEALEKENHYSKELEKVDLLTVQENGIYYVKQAQHAPNEEEKEGYFKVINHSQKLEENRIVFWHPCASSSGGYFNVLIEGRWLGWQQMSSISDLKQLLIPKAAEITQNPENYQAGQIYSIEGTTSEENGHPYSAEWTHLTYFVYGDEHVENGYKNIVGVDYRGKVYRKSQCWNQWTDWEQLVTLKELEGKADKFYTIFNKNVIQDEDLVGSAFTNKSWCGVGLNLEHAPTSNWLNYLCLDAAATGSDINQVLAMEINGSNPQCYFTNDAKGKKWKQFLFVEDLKERISHPNLLINSDFSNLINTEGKTSYSGKNQYTFDGWLLDSSNGMGTLDKSTARVDLFNNYNSEYIDFTQRLELGIIRAGENYTFSASTQVAKVNVTFTGRSSQSVQITEKLSFIYTAAEKYDAVTLRYTGYSYFIQWAKLEQGLIATKFLPRIMQQKS